ncbi:hypothetical protein BS78_09G008000 [Paspalum vaginatum]|nr:hypothetical protein BS78_09G008000 [Paspalum vaginatum]
MVTEKRFSERLRGFAAKPAPPATLRPAIHYLHKRISRLSSPLTASSPPPSAREPQISSTAAGSGPRPQAGVLPSPPRRPLLPRRPRLPLLPQALPSFPAAAAPPSSPPGAAPGRREPAFPPRPVRGSGLAFSAFYYSLRRAPPPVGWICPFVASSSSSSSKARPPATVPASASGTASAGSSPGPATDPGTLADTYPLSSYPSRYVVGRRIREGNVSPAYPGRYAKRHRTAVSITNLDLQSLARSMLKRLADLYPPSSIFLIWKVTRSLYLS